MKPIDADVLVKRINSIMETYPNLTVEEILDMIIYKTHALDVRPNIHAHWEPFEKEAYWIQDIEEIWETGKPTKQIQYKCSHCLAEFGTIVVEQNYMYCPKCSAKMDEEIEE